MIRLYHSEFICDNLTANKLLMRVYEALGPMHACAWPDVRDWLVGPTDGTLGELPTVSYLLNETEKGRLLDPSPSTVYQITSASLFIGMVRSALDRSDHQIVLTPHDLPRRETFSAIRWAGRLDADRPMDFAYPGWVIASTNINADECVIAFAHNSSCNFESVVELLDALFARTRFRFMRV